MAGVVKWLRPRIVVPICMGSNPISRPIYKLSFDMELFFSIHNGCILSSGLVITDGAIILGNWHY